MDVKAFVSKLEKSISVRAQPGWVTAFLLVSEKAHYYRTLNSDLFAGYIYSSETPIISLFLPTAQR